MKKPLIILTGPTAVGKTKLSIALAKAVNGEIISADSMQVYKYMDIGSAKITKEEMGGIKHYLIDEFKPDEEFNVVKFKEYACRYMEKIYEKGKIPILVGGTGFYIQAVLNDIDFSETTEDPEFRRELEILAADRGAEYLHDMLRNVDPESASAIHSNNVKRVIRALEYYKKTGSRISEHNASQKKKKSPYNFLYFVLNDNRDILYERIDQRVDQMLDQGLVDEVKTLAEKGYTRDLVSMQGLGYKEILAYMDGEMTLEEAVYTIKRDTRHFAKRQLTWFRRETDVTWIELQDYHSDRKEVLKAMVEKCKAKGIVK
ncbi:tRNA (adenosine(37)-N6)-dimethylallyltransferase MiaA [Anaerobium acetethylicum]|uniref:tRNA dimethylallyltransferase n=1 Tax=Anaerobium acetethylicum TaxID=1619234 RepID=A0A1D3TNZ2_9FIRM|nr:tRNA (adenosine(37)-N6)-dimethylallyltransferase MiaA [Anaerobium acetethylicum]SCP95045.1 tRNA dimethylallyltransferase [Anaerobium acetethylicum]